jgi:hypothetical protein
LVDLDGFELFLGENAERGYLLADKENGCVLVIDVIVFNMEGGKKQIGHATGVRKLFQEHFQYLAGLLVFVYVLGIAVEDWVREILLRA